VIDLTSIKDIITLEEALDSSKKEVIGRYRTYINPGLASILSMVGYDKKFTKAHGVNVFDSEGNKYLDFLGGYGSMNLGHNHPEIIEALNKIADFPNILQISMSSVAGALGETLANITPGNLKKTFFCNSGAEATEAALKLSRISTGRKAILYAENSFHGKTLGAVSVTGRKKYQEPFFPLVPECFSIAYGDVDVLEKELKTKKYAAFIVEPIQGEGGIIVPPNGYLKDAEKLCKDNGTLFIADEVQTGLGRTGNLFATQYERVEPDIMILSKSLGGGVMPIGACISTEEVWSKGYGSRDRCLLHTSTFGGNARACAAGLKTIEILIREDLATNARIKGESLLKSLKEVAEKYQLVKEIRGRGLLIGAEFYEPKIVKGLSKEYLAGMVSGILNQQYHIITAYTLNNPNVIRFEPPLIVTDEHIDYVADSFEGVCKKYKGFSGIALNVSKRMIKKHMGFKKLK